MSRPRRREESAFARWESAAALSMAVTLCALSGALRAGEDARTEPQAMAARVLEDSLVRGGLVVHLACGSGRLTAELGRSAAYQVHGLERDSRLLQEARAHIRSLGIYGRVCVDSWRGNKLPYADNLVRLLVSEKPLEIPVSEVVRVLAPGGVAFIQAEGGWSKTVKPWPEEIDEWTHYLHDSTGNPVSKDLVVGPPRRLQWVGSPRWARHHDHMASMSSLVSAGGRIFYIFDEGPTSSIQLPSSWSLIARDAFSGAILWKRPLESWNTQLWPLKSGPAQVTRRLVAAGARIYVTLGLDAPLHALDAATGEIVRKYQGSKNTEEVIFSDGTLFLLANEEPSEWSEYRPTHTYCWDETARANRIWSWNEEKRRILAYDAETGNKLWQREERVAPMTLAARGERVLFHDGEKVVCLHRKSGDVAWSSEPVGRRRIIQSSFGPNLVVHGDVVLFSGGNRSMTALSFQDGKTLWSAEHPRSGHQSQEDLLVAGGLVWCGETAGGEDSGIMTGRDLMTGEVKEQFPPDIDIYWFHHRCYRSKATEKYLLLSRTGIECVDFRAKHWEAHHWVRGGCIYGVMPANGLIYAPPHDCACYVEAKLYGFCALAPDSPAAGRTAAESSDEARLERGAAFESVAGETAAEGPGEDEWPTYRHDAARSGWTKAAAPYDLVPAWRVKVGGKLSAPVIAGGKVYVADVDAHAVHSLDAGDGSMLWRFTAGGRVDSPPTIHRGSVLFGSADGWVYCLRAADGELAWRFRAAPEERLVGAFEQLESAWPVHGSVLLLDGVVYCVAGRSMFLDGGLRFLRLDAKTGRKIGEVVLDERDPETGQNLQVHVKGLNMPVGLTDVLSSDGNQVYMRSQRFDLQGKRLEIAPGDVAEQIGEGVHLFAPAGFLDDSWWHRSYWMVGRKVASGWGGWFRAGRLSAAGRILVSDDSHAYAFARKPEYLCQSSVLEYHLYGAPKGVRAERIQRVVSAEASINAKGAGKRNSQAADWRVRKDFPPADLSAVDFTWSCDQPPLHARAMVLAGGTLFVAGPPDVADEKDAFRSPDDPEIGARLDEQVAALEGRRGGILWAVSAADGKRLAEYHLDTPPVWDGMAAAGGRLYLAAADGRLLCWGQARSSADHVDPEGGG